MSNMPHKENRYRRGEQVLQGPFRSEIFRSSQAVESCGFGQIMEKASTRPRAIKLKRTRDINSPTLRTFAPKSSYGEIFFISCLELVDKVLTPKMKKKMRVTDFVSEKLAVEKCLNFEKSVIITRCSLLC